MTATPSTEQTITTLGSFAWWDLHKVQVTADKFRAELRAEGFTSHADDVDDVNSVQNVRNFTRAWTHGRGNADRFRAEIAKDSKDAITVGILIRVQKGDAAVAWEQVGSVDFDRVIGFGNPTNHPKVTEFVTDCTPWIDAVELNDVRVVLKKVMLGDWRGFPIRQQGGIYYIPRKHRDQLPALQRVVENLGPSTGDAKLHVVNVEAGEGAAQSIASAAKDSIADRIDSIRARIDTWKAGSVRSSSVERAVRELLSIRDDAELIADSLGLALEDAKDLVSDAVREFRALLDTETPAPVVATAPEVVADVGSMHPLEARLREMGDTEIGAYYADLFGGVVPANATREAMIADIVDAMVAA